MQRSIPTKHVDVMLDLYSQGYPLSEISKVFPQYDLYTDIFLYFKEHNLITKDSHRKKLKRPVINQIKKSLIVKINRGCISYNDYLKKEIKRLEGQLCAHDITDFQKFVIKSTINKYRFIIRAKYTKHCSDTSSMMV